MYIIEKALGGTVAEELIYGRDNISVGASDDLQRATKLARSMVERFGMSDLGKLELVDVYDRYGVVSQISQETKREIDLEVRRIIQDAYERVKKQLTQHQKELHALAQALVEYESLSGKEVEDILAGRPIRVKSKSMQF